VSTWGEYKELEKKKSQGYEQAETCTLLGVLVGGGSVALCGIMQEKRTGRNRRGLTRPYSKVD